MNAKAISDENRVEDIVECQNIPRVTYVSADMLNAYDIIRHDNSLLPRVPLSESGRCVHESSAYDIILCQSRLKRAYRISIK